MRCAGLPTSSRRSTLDLIYFRTVKLACVGEWSLLRSARVARRMTQETVARLAGTSQATLSAYERGAKSPSLAVTERILYALGYRLDIRDVVTFHTLAINDDGWTIHVPDRLWRVDPPHCFLDIVIGGRGYDPSDSRQRVEAYVLLLEHADQQKIFNHVDAALLVASWSAISKRLREPVRRAWAPLVRDAQDQAKWIWDNLVSDEAKRKIDRRTPRKRSPARLSSRRRGGRPSGG